MTCRDTVTIIDCTCIYLYFPPFSPECSDSESSIASCSDLVAALEALTIELQEKRLSESKAEEEELHSSVEKESTELTREHTPIVRTSSGPGPTAMTTATGEEGSAVSSIGAGRQSPVKSLTHAESATSMAEKEKILNDCMNQIKVCAHAMCCLPMYVCMCVLWLVNLSGHPWDQSKCPVSYPLIWPPLRPNQNKSGGQILDFRDRFAQ